MDQKMISSIKYRLRRQETKLTVIDDTHFILQILYFGYVENGRYPTQKQLKKLQ